MHVHPAQLLLFAELPPPRRVRSRRRRVASIVVAVGVVRAPCWVQLELAGLGDTDFDYPVHAVVRASDVPAPRTRAVASIFHMAAALKGERQVRFRPEAAVVRASAIEKAPGVVRIVGAQYPANRWTPEREEAERARRARQKPPKPPKKARTRGKKVRVWDGEAVE